MRKGKLFVFMLIFVAGACTRDFTTEDIGGETSADEELQLKSASVSSSPDVNFGLAVKYDTGKLPSVGVNSNGIAVEVHQSENHDYLYYHAGKVNQMDVTWSSSSRYSTSGEAPQVDINDSNYIVQVHEAGSSSNLYARVGVCNGSSISWKAGSYKYTTGANPSIALNNSGWCVEVHNSSNEENLYYLVGKISSDGKKVSWGSSYKYTTGYNPKVSINSSGLVVAVHKSENNDGLWCRVGQISTSSKKISWKSNTKYDYGKDPDIALADDGTVVEVHRSQNYRTLWKRRGTVSGSSIVWESSECFDDGVEPSVALASDGSMALQVHESDDTSNMFFSSSLLINRATWMEDEYANLSGKKLYEICLPGSHDAGAYKLSGDLASCSDDLLSFIPSSYIEKYALTQDLDIGEQLEAGIRYFDLRACYDDGNFYVYHSLIGDKMETLLKDFASYLSAVDRELVVIKISHFCGFNSSRHEELAALVKKYLGTYLYTGSGSIPDTEFDTFVANGPSVVLWYDNDDVCDSNVGFFDSIGIYDKYSDTDSYSSMKSNQYSKLKSYYGKSGRLFLLSWTLTPDDDISWDLINGSMEDLSTDANRNLRDFVASYGTKYQINVLYTDYVEDAASTDCAVMLNRQ